MSDKPKPKQVDIAVDLEADADKLPNLVFTKAGKLLAGEPEKPKPRDA